MICNYGEKVKGHKRDCGAGYIMADSKRIKISKNLLNKPDKCPNCGSSSLEFRDFGLKFEPGIICRKCDYIYPIRKSGNKYKCILD